MSAKSAPRLPSDLPRTKWRDSLRRGPVCTTLRQTGTLCSDRLGTSKDWWPDSVSPGMASSCRRESARFSRNTHWANPPMERSHRTRSIASQAVRYCSANTVRARCPDLFDANPKMTMKILVPVKRVVDANVRVRIGSAGTVDTTGLKMSLNPFDECAVEQALRLREAGIASSVTVLTCGLPVCQYVLRTALAMGADDAVLIDTASASPDSLGIARLLHAFMITDAGADAYGLVLCGKQ